MLKQIGIFCNLDPFRVTLIKLSTILPILCKYEIKDHKKESIWAHISLLESTDIRGKQMWVSALLISFESLWTKKYLKIFKMEQITQFEFPQV